jgi:DNA-binding GntR family transcriptional regulator
VEGAPAVPPRWVEGPAEERSSRCEDVGYSIYVSARAPAAAANGSRGAGRARLVRSSTGDLVTEHVRRLIFGGDLRPGDRIPIDTIAEELGVSRLPVREALLGLARDGLVAMAPHQGAYVGSFDEDVVRDHFEIVGMVQGLAAARLAARAEPDVLAELIAVAERLEATRDAQAAYDLTMEFQRLVNVGGGSARQRSVLRALARMLPTGFFADVAGSAASGRLGTRRVLDAILGADEDDIRRICVEVQRERGELVVAHLRKRGVFPATRTRATARASSPDEGGSA